MGIDERFGSGWVEREFLRRLKGWVEKKLKEIVRSRQIHRGFLNRSC